MPKIIADPTNKIIAASLDVLKKYGEEKFSMRLVAKKANISVGTIYNYYPDKESLLKAIDQRQGENLCKEISSYRLKGRELPKAIEELYDKAYRALDLASSQEAVIEVVAKAFYNIGKKEGVHKDFYSLLSSAFVLGIKENKDKQAILLLAKNALK